MIIQDP